MSYKSTRSKSSKEDKIQRKINEVFKDRDQKRDAAIRNIIEHDKKIYLMYRQEVADQI